MSGKTCVRTYCNYGSYLRSRGYDKAICDLITMIENGKIPIGPFKPKDACNALIEGTLEIVECPSVPNVPGAGGPDNGTGQLWIMGGYAGEETPSPAALPDLGLQVKHGQHTQGPVIQTRSIATAPNGAVIPGGDHKVTIAGGLPGNPANTGNPPNPNLLPLSIPQLTNANYFEYDTIFTKEVHIGGNLLVDGSGTIQHAAEADTILLRPFAAQDRAKLKIFGINSTLTKNKELVSVWHGDGGFINQADIENDWLNSLAFSIDGYPESPYVWSTADFGQTGINGRTRALQGLTVTDPNYMGLGGALPNPPYLNATNADIQQNALDIRGNVLISAGSNGSPATGTTPATLEFEAGSMINMQSNNITGVAVADIDTIIRQNPAPAAGAALSTPGNVNNNSLATTQAIKTYVESVVDLNNDLQFSGTGGSGTVSLANPTQTFNIAGANSSANITTTASNQDLTIDLTNTGVSANAYGAATVATDNTQSIRVPNFTVDQKGRLTAAGQSTVMNVMSSFEVEANTSPPSASGTIENGDKLEFSASSGPSAYNVNLKVELASGVIEYQLNQNLKLESILLGAAATSPIVTEIVESTSGISAPGDDTKLATEKAIVDYITGVNSGFTITANGTSASINDGDTLTAVDGVNTTAFVTTTPKRVGWNLNSVLNKIESVNGAGVSGPGGYSLSIKSLSAASGPNNNINIELSPGATGGGTQGHVDVTSGYMNIGAAPGNAQTAAGNLNVARAVTASSFIGGGVTPASGGNPTQGEISTQGFINISSGGGGFTPTNTPGNITVQGTAAIGGSASIDGALTVRGNATIGDAPSDTLTITGGTITAPAIGSSTGISGLALSNYKVLLINSSGQVAQSLATASSIISSLRYKENVEIMTEEAAGDLMKIMPRTFNYKGSNDETFGLIAEELAGTELKAAVSNDSEGRPDAINYSMLVAPLLRIVQDQNDRIKALEEKVEALSK